MKVLYFHQHFSTPQGATGTRSYENALRLIASGHAVTMVCGSYKTGTTGLSGEYVRGRRSGVVDGIKVIELQLPYANELGLVRRSMVFLKFAIRSIWIGMSEDYDVLFATSTPLTASIPGIFARIFRRKPFVFEVRDLWPELPKAMGVVKNPIVLSMLDALERVSYWSANSCIGLSPGIVDGIRMKASSNKNVVFIPNGCDEEFLEKQDRGNSKFARNSPQELIAVFTGAHGIANGLDAVLDAAIELEERDGPEIQIVFIGDGQRKSALRERTMKENIRNVTFLDPMPKTELRSLLADADVGLMILANVPAFYYGTSPNKFFDYIALGLPVVNNYPGWLAEMISEEDLGVVVSPDMPSELADALIYLADNPDIRRDQGLRARNLAVSKFRRKVLSERFVRELERVASA